MLAAAQRPNSLPGQIAGLLELSSERVAVDGTSLFAPERTTAAVDLAEWVTFAQVQDADRDDGLVFVDGPSEVN
jgi:hypothetical protein